jgi:hypothetical protein
VRRGCWTLVVAVLLVVAGCATPGVAAAEGDVAAIGAWPGDPSGGKYPERRQCVESQGWWMPGLEQPATFDSEHGHAHMGACIPERETLSGDSVSINVRLVLHDNPGTWNYVSMIFKSPTTEVAVQKCYAVASAADGTCPAKPSSGKGNWRCDLDENEPGAQGTCTKWLTFKVPLSAFNNSGLQEMRLRGFIPEPKRSDGVSPEMRTNLNWQAYVNNGKAKANVSRQTYVRGKGWYTNSLYCEAAVLSVPLPDGPVDPGSSLTVDLVDHSTDESLPVTSHLVSWDPDFHADPPVDGDVVAEGPGPLPATAVKVPTSPGLHRLFQKASCQDNKLASTNSGVLIVPVEVN